MRTRFPLELVGYLENALALVQAGRVKEAAALIRQARDFFPGVKDLAWEAERLVPSANSD
jgi:riboflavin synthase